MHIPPGNKRKARKIVERAKHNAAPVHRRSASQTARFAICILHPRVLMKRCARSRNVITRFHASRGAGVEADRASVRIAEKSRAIGRRMRTRAAIGLRLVSTAESPMRWIMTGARVRDPGSCVCLREGKGLHGDAFDVPARQPPGSR